MIVASTLDLRIKGAVSNIGHSARLPENIAIVFRPVKRYDMGLDDASLLISKLHAVMNMSRRQSV